MPIRQFHRRPAQDHQELVQRLVHEWTQPNPTATEPVIIEEFNNAGDLAHVYVVWNDWAHVDQAQRGQIIMDAAESRYGRAETAAVTIALGLTPVEADQMGLDWR